MNHLNFLKAASLVGVCAIAAAACESGARSPMSPSAVVGGTASANADGSTLKVTAPVSLGPTDGTLNATTTPTLTVREAQALFNAQGTVKAPTLAHRFQVSDSESFSNIVASGIGSLDAQGLVRYVVSPALGSGKKYFWRARGELDDAFGPWTIFTLSFVTGGSTPPPPSGSGSGTGSGTLPRTPDPPAGQKLPLPDRRDVLSRFSDARDSCPLGVKYVNNPWQDRVIDAFRQTDSRWGYNGKPNRRPSDNGGRAVVAAGDEAAYHRGSGPDLNSTDVELVDMLLGHCGPSPTLTWRVFTGEEPGFWTDAGRGFTQ